MIRRKCAKIAAKDRDIQKGVKMKEIRNQENVGNRRNGASAYRREGSFFLSTATRALIIGVAVIVVCIVCSLALYMSKQGKAAINTGTNQYNKMLEDYQDLNKAMYDGLEVSGSEVTTLISKLISLKEYTAVRVKTKASDFVCYNYFYNEADNSIDNKEGREILMELSEARGADHYINPQADFLGSVKKNANGIIICIDFVQQ